MLISKTNADLRLEEFFISLMEMIENTSKSSEDSILLAGAMMSMAKILYFQELGPKEGQDLLDRGTFDVVEILKPTIH
jgi:hypothetical protein|tara:strand:+ start:644 stop:877 length:234 start_codon:yes stop_codon:yes gene_type:complete